MQAAGHGKFAVLWLGVVCVCRGDMSGQCIQRAVYLCLYTYTIPKPLPVYLLHVLTAGGQVGDHGVLKVVASGATEQQQETVLLVSGVRKAAGGRLFVHSSELQSGVLSVGQKVSHKSIETLLFCARAVLAGCVPAMPPSCNQSTDTQRPVHCTRAAPDRPVRLRVGNACGKCVSVMLLVA